MTLILFALFLSLGLSPVVLRLERLTGSRVRAVLIVMVSFLLIETIVLLLLLPVIIDPAAQLIKFLPTGATTITQQEWFMSLDDVLGSDPLDHQGGHRPGPEPAVVQVERRNSRSDSAARPSRYWVRRNRVDSREPPPCGGCRVGAGDPSSSQLSAGSGTRSLALAGYRSHVAASSEK